MSLYQFPGRWWRQQSDPLRRSPGQWWGWPWAPCAGRSAAAGTWPLTDHLIEKMAKLRVRRLKLKRNIWILSSKFHKTGRNHQWARCWCPLWCGIHSPAPSPRHPAACTGWPSWCTRGRGCWGPGNEPADQRRSESAFKKGRNVISQLGKKKKKKKENGKLLQLDKD